MSMVYGEKYFIKDEKHFIKLQQHFFDRGYKWCSHNRGIHTFDSLLVEDIERPFFFYIKYSDKVFFVRTIDDGGYKSSYDHSVYEYQLKSLDYIPEEMFEL